MRGFIESWPQKDQADEQRSFWACELRKLDTACRFGVAVRRLPGSHWWAITVEPMQDDAERKAARGRIWGEA